MADMFALIKEMAMMPVREIPTEQLLQLKDMNDIRAVDLRDFNSAILQVAPSVSKQSILEFDKWRREKG